MKLSKTDFLIYRDCAHNAWVKLHEPDVYNAKPMSAFDLGLLETGNEVDDLARNLFPGGTTIARGDAATTRRLVAARTSVLYQPVFETEEFTTACDILVWNAASQRFDLYEVKASTNGDDKRVKDDLYTHDLAFQVAVLCRNEVPLGRQFIIRLDSEYVRCDELDVRALFAVDDLTDRVAEIREVIAHEMDTAHDVLASDRPLPGSCTCMTKGRSAHCTTFARTNTNVPDYSVHDITRIGASKKKLARLIDAGVLAITNVPDDIELSETQSNQVRAAKTGRTSIDVAAIAAFLSGLAFPLSFLDYETYPAAVPRFPGYGPFYHIPFQLSLHVIERPGATPVHHEFLHTDTTCPDAGVIAALERAMPRHGGVLTWNQSFEKGINDKLAARNPQAAAFLADINARIVDLMDVFSSQAYVHPGFRGRTSIKAILPVLVPSLSYKALAIQEGATATTRWNQIVTGQIDAAAAVKIRTELLAYCCLDTLAMVEIWRALTQVAAGKRQVG